MTIRVVPTRLQGAHVVLEPISEIHIDGLYAVGQEAEDWVYLPVSAFRQRQDAERWVRQALGLAETGEHITFVMVHPATQEPMGSTRFLNIRARDHGLEIGYTWLGRRYQRSAVNTEAKYLLLRHAFEVIGAYRVELKTDLRNERSQKAIERIGARKEGVFRRHMVVQDGLVRDSVYYSITDLDWPSVKRSLEAKLASSVSPI